MLDIWDSHGGARVNEQRLADQVRVIIKKGWLTELEIEEIERGIRSQEVVVRGDTNELDETSDRAEGSDRAVDRDRAVGNTVSTVSVEENDTARVELPVGLNDETKTIIQSIRNKMGSESTRPSISLRNLDRNKVRMKARQINEALKYIPTSDITETNRLIVAASNEVMEQLGVKHKETRKVREPWWKRRIEGQIKQLRKDISQLDSWAKNRIKKDRITDRLESKYYVKNKGIRVVIEELRQRVLAKAAKVRRYEDRIKQYRQNRMFQSNQKRLFEELDGECRNNTAMPDAEESRNFWSSIWGQSKMHNTEADWLKDVRKEYADTNKQQNVGVTIGLLDRQLKKVPNWKAPGADGVQGFWLKNFTSLRVRICEQFNQCLESGEVPGWMTRGRTVLIMKDKDKGSDVKNFRPITCLPLMWKLLTGVLADQMYRHLEENQLLPNEQKGCRKNARGTKDQLLIDRAIIRNCKRRKTGIGMAWIDYKKAYDMVPHSWIIECMQIFGIAGNMSELITRSMGGWTTELTSGDKVLGEVGIKRGIFQGDSLSPLLFVLALIPLTLVLRKTKVGYDMGKNGLRINHLLFMDDLKLYGKNESQIDSLVQTVRVFTEDIQMEFGISKCASLIMKRGKVVDSMGISLPNKDRIKAIGEEDSYKYLGVLESDDIKNEEMKGVITTEYFRRVRKILQSKLNGGNTITAINSRAVAVVRYSAGIVKWTKEELRVMDTKTRKLMTMNRALHPQADVDRLYVKRAMGGRGLISIQDCVALEIDSLSRYVEKSEEPMLKEVKKECVLKEQHLTEDFQKDRLEKYKGKELHGKFLRETEDGRDPMTWDWLRTGVIKKETEGLIMAAQDQALRTNAIRKYIDKQDVSPVCRMCGERDETISHILTECSKLAQKHYKSWRHDKVAQILHWETCGRIGVQRSAKWYDHEPEGVVETSRHKVLWDFKVQTDKRVEHNRPDLVIYDKEEQACKIIDVACPFDTRVKKKALEKVERYEDLKREVRRIWKCKEVEVVPVIIGALGTVHQSMKGWLRRIDMEGSIGRMQQACILGSARILRKVLDT